MPRKPPPEGHLLYILGALIRKQRLSRGLTQTDLGTLSGGIDRRTIAQYEQGLRNPGIDVLFRMARACDMPLSLFLAPLDNAKVTVDELEADADA